MDIFVEAAKQVQIIRYTTVATITVVTYEYLIRLDSEIRYLWCRRFTLAKGLLLLCRYLPFLFYMQLYVYVVTAKVIKSNCAIGVRVSASFVYVEFVLAILVLFTRAYAVWGGTLRMFTFLALIYAGGIAGTAYSLFLYVDGLSVLELRLVGDGCLFLATNDSLWIALALLVFCESLALVLLLTKSIQHARAIKNVMRVRNPGQNILLIMAQDGIGYFVCSLAITSANLVVLVRATTNLRSLLFVVQGAIQGILCARLLFHIHAVDESPNGTYRSQATRTALEIEMQARGINA
ncbi:hypothetical protein SCHPADRAFT_942832 [Schizopora paradoxa]|uniref:DUF6533 domain-containing protein n=1 Tax=Schizopora paradoxa TaxID=27342 RepID=A0A0H2RF32_9AGAM|nr:hypothetical protein SCHPADRAFT_942832 [Schizopora paradoxa]